jgi:hypothetical protein
VDAGSGVGAADSDVGFSGGDAGTVVSAVGTSVSKGSPSAENFRRSTTLIFGGSDLVSST